MPAFSRTVLVLAAVLAIPVPPAAAAEDCLEIVRQIYRDDLDPFARPPYRSVRIHRNAAGDKTAGFDNRVETPLRTISQVHGGAAALVIDRESWTGPGPEGPWTPAPAHFPADRAAVIARERAQSLANLADARCHGEVEVEGQTLLHYGFTTRTDPDPERGGLWFGAREEVFLDPGTRRVMRWERSDFVSSFAGEPSGERSVETFEYDDAVTVRPPEG